MAAVKQKLTNVNAEIPVVEGKHEEYVCFLAYATIANSGMEASEGSSWARDWHGYVQKLKSGTATLSEFEQLDKLELLNHGRKYTKKAQDHAGSQCFVCRCTLDPAFALAWTSGRTICLWCQAWDDKDKEEMRNIDTVAIEEEISKISCHLEELTNENKSSSPGIKTPFNGVRELHPFMGFSEFERLDSVDRHQTCTCKKLVCTCITPEPSETDGEINSITGDMSASGFLPKPIILPIMFADTPADKDKPAKKRKTDQDIPVSQGPPLALGPTQVVAKPPVAQSIASMGPAKGTQEQAKGQDIAEVKENPSVADNPIGETPSAIKAGVDLEQCPWRLNKSSVLPPAPSSSSQTYLQSTLVVPKPANVDPQQPTPRNAPTPRRIVPPPRMVPPPEPQPTPRFAPPPPPPPPPQGKPLLIKIR
jgi:hypothetical protein